MTEFGMVGIPASNCIYMLALCVAYVLVPIRMAIIHDKMLVLLENISDSEYHLAS